MRWGTWISVTSLTFVSVAFGQCAPGPDSSYFFRDLTQRRAAPQLSEDRAFFETLLSATFANRAAFIDGELAAAQHPKPEKPAVTVRNFSLLEHRKGFVVASYELVGGGAARWFRDVYQVEGGKWRLASSQAAPPAGHQDGGT
jgi:hypothetical protein